MLFDVAAEEKPYRVQSVDKAIDVLYALADADEPLTITQISEEVEGSKSAVFSTVQTLVARGLVLSTGTGLDRRYQLGLEFARLGDLVISRFAFGPVAKPFLEELTAATGLTSRAAAWGDDSAIAVARVDGRGAVKFNLHMGERELLHCSSVGKAMLATMSDEAVIDLLSGLELTRKTPKTKTTITALLEDLAVARKRGYAVDDEEDADGIICIGAAVLDRQGVTRGAISVTRIKGDIADAEIRRLGELTKAYAKQISASIGASD